MNPDPFQLKSACTCHPSAMGHVFRGLLRCECGRKWLTHQRDPSPCPKAELNAPIPEGRAPMKRVLNERCIARNSPRKKNASGVRQ
jgi:hypothetical protein